MKIAVAHTGGFVAPRLDLAEGFLLVEVEKDGSEIARESLSVNQFAHPLSLINAFKTRDVDTLICGAINAFFMRLFDFHGIRIVSWVDAPVDEAVKRCAKGMLREGYSAGRTIPPGQMAFPCRGRRRRRRGYGKQRRGT